MKIIICGCNGKMGKAILKTIENSPQYDVVAGVDINNEPNGIFPVVSNISAIKEKADVIIDFSNPKALDSLLDYAQNSNTPVVICTTGLSAVQIDKIRGVSKKLPVFYSRNMSLGINLLIELSKIASKVLGENFDIEIIEKHHNQKIDAPSGTALMIAEEISSALPNEMDFVYNRSNVRKARAKNEIGIHSIRGGSIPGDHEVIFAGEQEIVSISHHAQSRDIFAKGAIKAAEFIINQQPGLYTMQDVVSKITV